VYARVLGVKGIQIVRSSASSLVRDRSIIQCGLCPMSGLVVVHYLVIGIIAIKTPHTSPLHLRIGYVLGWLSSWSMS
jgi:hypothetical protein